MRTPVWVPALAEMRYRIATQCTIALGASFDATVIPSTFGVPNTLAQGDVMVVVDSIQQAETGQTQQAMLTISVAVVLNPVVDTLTTDTEAIIGTQANDILIALDIDDRFDLCDEVQLGGVDYPSADDTGSPLVVLNITLQMLARRGDHSQGR